MIPKPWPQTSVEFIKTARLYEKRRVWSCKNSNTPLLLNKERNAERQQPGHFFLEQVLANEQLAMLKASIK